MQLLKRWVLRLWDAGHAACAVLFGTLELRSMKPTRQVKQSAEHAKAMLEVTSLLEMMHNMISRMGARESRAAKKILSEVGEQVGPSGTEVPSTSPMSTKDRKQQLRAYVSAQRFGGVAPPPAPPEAPPAALENPNGDDQLELEEEP